MVPKAPYNGSITDIANKAITDPKKIINMGSKSAVNVSMALFTSLL